MACRLFTLMMWSVQATRLQMLTGISSYPSSRRNIDLNGCMVVIQLVENTNDRVIEHEIQAIDWPVEVIQSDTSFGVEFLNKRLQLGLDS